MYSPDPQPEECEPVLFVCPILCALDKDIRAATKEEPALPGGPELLPVREQQILRLQVKSDGSVLDPAVQSSILEQIKQKLAEKGMLENTTVTWRVQTDGNIFQKKNKDDL
ncbi:hypothetical protein KOW79_022734 [Hemibagrus wyckioides]|uniref:Uncharacterized protein n=1 Tax=Hemibagrus wyckioides TaxID=337641 RepID=A0A9D3SBU0_9TELE|nr:hypothetical protein KOW79_022734 [Hemibagrus wyckioides]